MLTGIGTEAKGFFILEIIVLIAILLWKGMLYVLFLEHLLWRKEHYKPYDGIENHTCPEHVLTFHFPQNNHTIFY